MKNLIVDIVLVVLGGLAAVGYFTWTGSTLIWKKKKAK